MSQPTPYVRQTDFSDIQADAPSTPLPGNLLDQELDAVKATLDEILGNLALIQRDDFKLANQVVTIDTLHSTVRAGLGAPTPWAPQTAYALNDTVWESSVLYSANVAHTSGATFAGDSANWDTLAFFQDNASFVAKAGDTMTGELTVPSQFNVKAPGAGQNIEVILRRSDGTIAGNVFFNTTAPTAINVQLRDSGGNAVSQIKLYPSKVEFQAPVGTVINTFDFTHALGGILGDIQVYDTAGTPTWTKPAGLKFIRWRGCGTGGNGAGCATTGATEAAVGACGGGAAYAEGIIMAADLGATETVTIVAQVAPGSSTGAAGGSTTFGAHVTLPGGKGGTTQAAGTGVRMAFGGSHSDAPTISTGLTNLAVTGQAGGASVADAANNLVAGGGVGGASGFGGGPRAVTSGNGFDAGAYGAGGGGASNPNNQGTARNGGKGGIWLFIIEEFF